eukprot:tig00000984_g6001.t1
MSQAAVRPINVKALVAKMRACKCVKGLGGEPEVPLVPFVQLMREIAGLFKILGPNSFKTGSQIIIDDVSNKAEILAQIAKAAGHDIETAEVDESDDSLWRRVIELITCTSGVVGDKWESGALKQHKIATLQSMMRWEMQTGRIRQSGNGSRTTIRLRWLLDFLIKFSGLIQDRRNTIKDCGAQAYKETLAPHHPLPIRGAAKIAMVMIPSREDFCRKFAVVEPEALADMREFKAYAEPVFRSLINFHTRNNLNNLP